VSNYRRFYLIVFLWTPFFCHTSWKQAVVQDIKDTFLTGMPVACTAAVFWAFANRIPAAWKTLEGPASDFIYTTWNDQGFTPTSRVLLKCIPADSTLARLGVYTQELPGALGVSDTFVSLIESLLLEEEELQHALMHCTNFTVKKRLEIELKDVTHRLNECRFVCGHERVHKQYRHTYQLLGIQFLAPFFVYSAFKIMRKCLRANNNYPLCYYGLQDNIVRSATELAIGVVAARQFEYNADVSASKDIVVLKAGLGLFKKTLSKKISQFSSGPKQIAELLVGWLLQYTHPTLPERVWYLSRYIDSLEKEKHLERAV
jgi:hypothetical protein